MSYVRAWFFAGSVGTLVAAATRSGSAVAQVVQDPGVRGGPPGSGGPLPNLIPGGGSQPSQPGFFQAAQVFFTSVFSVTGRINDAPPGLTNGGPGLGPRYNLNSCAGCHAQPAVGGTSPPRERSGLVNPDDGNVTRGIFTNSYFNLSYPLPPGWTIGITGHSFRHWLLCPRYLCSDGRT
jgi:hypothetical protein